jgi:hypothetical protein
MLLGLVLGHWWRTTLVVSAIGWPVLLITTGVDLDIATVALAAALGAANAAIGILVHRLLWLIARGLTTGTRTLTS